MAKAVRNATETVRLQVSLDVRSAKLLDRIASHGYRGKNKSELAARILQDWVVDNAQEVLDRMESLSELADQNDEN